MSCWVLHKWTKWRLSHTHVYTVYQRRRCLKCGLLQQREIGCGGAAGEAGTSVEDVDLPKACVPRKPEKN